MAEGKLNDQHAVNDTSGFQFAEGGRSYSSQLIKGEQFKITSENHAPTVKVSKAEFKKEFTTHLVLERTSLPDGSVEIRCCEGEALLPLADDPNLAKKLVGAGIYNIATSMAHRAFCEKHLALSQLLSSRTHFFGTDSAITPS